MTNKDARTIPAQRIFSDAHRGRSPTHSAHSVLARLDRCEKVTVATPPMKETDYREIENSVAETLRVFLESKQKLTPFERACRDSLTSVLAEVVKRRIPVAQPKETALHEG
jgi:hypothetical protein